MDEIKKYTYSIDVNAPAAKVHDLMLGISNKNTYEQWTAPFNPTSTYRGTWEKGSRIYFVGQDEAQQTKGMIAEVAENIPGKFVSLRHIGMLDSDKEITEGPEVEKWAGGLENYTLEERDGITTVNVEIDLPESQAELFKGMWLKALTKLKEISESN
jgi:hypothetical protein